MKVHTENFKNSIKQFGRQLDSKITFQLNGEEIELGADTLNSISSNIESSILKSVMKELKIDSNIDIPINTVLNYKFGVLTNETENEYEYINFGNYVVYSSEFNADTRSYEIVCYDKMLYSMIDYDDMKLTYPISIRNYIQAICDKLGLEFASYEDNFANYNKMIPAELYLDLGYTYRDVLDELAQVTGSIICINNNDELEIRYITETDDIIDEDYLKDVNVTFGEKYGPINSIVLSRSAESDNVFLQDRVSIEENGLCEIKIKDNQIMNFNNRSEYLPDLLNRLGGLEYYLNDYSSPGICYYDVGDRYTVSVYDEDYSCVLFNQQINVTQGLEENIYTEKPEETETDYTKSDKVDNKINQTYLIVDKQNQQIESVITNVNDQNNKISQITQTVDELNSKIQNIANITISGESIFAKVDLNDINQSEPIMVRIRPTGENISYLYPHDNLYPSDTLYLKTRTLRFKNIETNEIFDYELPDDLLYYNANYYDEFYLNYDSQTCQIVKNCGYNADGTVRLLDTTITTNYPYPKINLTDGNYEISLAGYETAYLSVTLMAQNIYTTQFATKAELSSSINQTAESIELNVDRKLSNYSTTTEMNASIAVTANQINSEVSKKVGKTEVVSTINQSADQITLTSNRLVVDSTNFKLTKDGTMTANAGTFGGTINTSQDLIVGNNAYIGQNQSPTALNIKSLNFSDNSFLKRTKVGNSEAFSMNGEFLILYFDEYVEFHKNNGLNTFRVSENNTTISTPNTDIDSTYIYFASQPHIGSDKRLKDKIKDINVNWIKDLKVKEYEYKNNLGKKQIGLIAQDYVDKEYSKYFLDKNDEGYYSISYGNINNALIKYCQELNNKIEDLEKRISKLEGDDK